MGRDGACEAGGPSPFFFLCNHEAAQEISPRFIEFHMFTRTNFTGRHVQPP